MHDVLNSEMTAVLNAFPEQMRFVALSFVGETGRYFARKIVEYMNEADLKEMGYDYVM